MSVGKYRGERKKEMEVRDIISGIARITLPYNSYLAMKDITKKWTGRRQDWSSIYAQLVIYYGDRIPE
ncbi:hypothetical protein SAMN02910353_00061 [Ruminococcus sp. YRD2003]|nr:hypothetical protein SAMN02910353_00061 [Ruminococcus flavefaciens]